MNKIEMIFNLMFMMMTCNLFFFNYNHIIINLIFMEFMIINLLMFLYMNMLIFNMNIFFISFFLVISICESIMGLSILVLMIRFSGNDTIKYLNLIK